MKLLFGHLKKSKPLTIRESSLFNRVLICSVLAVSLTACSEVRNEEFEDYNQALALVEKGWIPAWMPTTSTDISVSYGIDTNEFYVRFSPNTGQEWVPSHCTKTANRPPESRIALSENSATASGKLDYYECEEKTHLKISKALGISVIWGN